MSAQERLAAAIEAANLVPFVYDEERVDVPDGAEPLGDGFHHVAGDRSVYHISIADIFAADPHLAQDIEDGAALRRLREAWPGCVIRWHLTDGGHIVIAKRQRFESVFAADGDTLAQAADACREAIEAQR